MWWRLGVGEITSLGGEVVGGKVTCGGEVTGGEMTINWMREREIGIRICNDLLLKQQLVLLVVLHLNLPSELGSRHDPQWRHQSIPCITF